MNSDVTGATTHQGLPVRPVSAVLVVKNEQAALESCLSTLSWCNEILVVDSGSTDNTCEIAKAYGARLVFQEWLGYGRQKDFAVRQAANDWVLCIDADERVSPELRTSIETALTSPRYCAYEFARRNRFMGRWLRHGEGYPDWSLRLFDRREAGWSEDSVHERVVSGGKVGRLVGDLLHESAETLHSYLIKQNTYTSLQADILFRNGRRPNILKMLISPTTRFVKFYFFRAGFLDGIPGLIHILIGCINTFLKNAKLLALWRQDTMPKRR
jgi:glycosyltransferase involved in cell wall biosynthesis